MKAPSDAQAAVLSCVRSHEQRGEYVLTLAAEAVGSRRLLVVERDDHGPLYGVQRFIDIDHDLPALVGADHASPRTVTLGSCVRHGWLCMDHEVRVTSQRLGTAWHADPREYVLRQLDMTEDGLIALGLWTQRKLAEPFQPPPTLEGIEREVVELAARAAGYGYRLAPISDNARREARKLAREGWVKREYMGAGTKALVPTALGSVEVNPEAADAPSLA